jgi:hypothetical protein
VLSAEYLTERLSTEQEERVSYGGHTDQEAEQKALVAHGGHDADDAHGHDAHGGHGEHEEHEHIHLPPPSYWPFLLALCITVLFTGFLTTLVISGIGALLCLFCIIMWGREQSQALPDGLTYVETIGEGDPEEQIAAGARVFSRDGKFVGRITFATEDTPIVRQGWIPTRYGYMPRSAIDHIEEGAVYLNLTEAQIRERGNVDITPAGPGSPQLMAPTGRAALRSGTTQQ